MFKGVFVGKSIYAIFRDKFPQLINFVDAKTSLSIQVHHSDSFSKKRHNSFGENEIWCMMQANEHAESIMGF